MLADELDYVIGVDTHRDEHALRDRRRADGRVDRADGRGASGRGYAEAVRFAERHARGAASGRSRAPVTTAPACPLPQQRGERCTRPGAARAERRLRGKDDSLDAIRAARSALATRS